MIWVAARKILQRAQRPYIFSLCLRLLPLASFLILTRWLLQRSPAKKADTFAILGLEETLQITCAVKHTTDLDLVVNLGKKDQIVAMPGDPQTLAKIIA